MACNLDIEILDIFTSFCDNYYTPFKTFFCSNSLSSFSNYAKKEEI